MIPGYYGQVLKQTASPQAKKLLAHRLTPHVFARQEGIIRELSAILARGGRASKKPAASAQQNVDAAITRMGHIKAQKIFYGELRNDDRLWIGMIPFNQLSLTLFDNDGPFREQLSPFCFDLSGDIALLSEHIKSPPYGFTFTNQLDVWQTREGLWFQYAHSGPGEPPPHSGLSPCLRIYDQDVTCIGDTRIHTVKKAGLSEISIISDPYGGGPAYPGTRIVC